MAGALTPIFRWAISVDGEPSPGALLYTYASGTSTPLSVYNNADLDPSHAHSNPVVADADGVFPVIYLAAAAYRFLVTDSLGTTIYPAQDNIYDLYQLSTVTNQNANLIYAGPTTAPAAAPTFRRMVVDDLPVTLTNGQLLIGNTGFVPTAAALTAGPGITVTNAAGAITLTGGGYLLDKQLTEVSASNTVAETSLYSFTVPANTLGTTKALRLTVIGNVANASGGSATYTPNFKFGGSSFLTTASGNHNNTTTCPFRFVIEITPNGATNSQRAVGWWYDMGAAATSGAFTTSGTATFIGYNNAMAIDTTAAQVLQLTVTNSTATSFSTTAYAVLLELLQ